MTREALRMRRRILVGTIGALAVLLATVSLAWACVPQGSGTLDPPSGPAGASATVTVSGFPPGPIEVRWNGLSGRLLASGNGPTVPITIPADAAPGTYTVIAAATGDHAEHSAARMPFTIPGAGDPPPGGGPPPDDPPPTTPPPTTPPPSGAIQTPVSAIVPKPGGKTINGTSRADTLRGTPFADVINCGAGNDRVRGGGGNDVINCGGGRDRVDGGAGNDRIGGGAGNDRLSGGSGNDRVSGGGGKDKLFGGSGSDRLLGGPGNDVLKGNADKDRLFGNGGADILFRGGGDRLFGGSGKNRVVG